MRKILSLVLVLVMVLSIAVTAIAAPNTVTLKNEDAKYGATTTLLKAVTATGIVKGDGTSAPSANATITRWQLALIALRLKTFDLDDDNWANYVVDYGNEDVVYADTNEAYDKALGAILYVQANGIIKGYEEDGKIYFKPAQVITYAEALAVFVRICGWDSVQMNSNWPYNYVAQAEKLGLTDGIKGVALDDELTYGTLAKLIYNALASDKYISAEYIQDILDVINSDADIYSKLVNLLIDFTAEYRVQEFTEADAIAILSELGTTTFQFGYFDLDGEYHEFAKGPYTVIKNATTISASLAGADISATTYDLEELRGDGLTDNEDGLLGSNQRHKWYNADGERFLLDTRKPTTSSDHKKPKTIWMSWCFYELDEAGQPIAETRTPALTLEQNTQGLDISSANAWYLQTLGKKTAMVYEPITDDDYIVYVNVNGDKYVTPVDGDVVQAAIDKAVAAVDVTGDINMDDIRDVAEIYLLQTYIANECCNDEFPGSDKLIEAAFGKNSIYLLTADEKAILCDVQNGNWTFWDGGRPQLDPGFAVGGFDYDNYKNPGYLDQLLIADMSNTLAEMAAVTDLGGHACKTILDYAYWRTYNILYAEAVEAATLKAIQDTIADEMEDYLAAIAPENLVRWTDATVYGWVDNSDDEFVAEVWGIKAVCVEDSKVVEWVGAENAVGSYVKETVVVDGVKTVTKYKANLYTMPAFNGNGVPATELSATVEFYGELTSKTYGAWCIDTNGDDKYDVVVYASFVE